MAKLDAFERRPHWHQSIEGAGETVTELDSSEPVSAAFELLESIPDLLAAAGFQDSSSIVGEASMAQILERVREAVRSVTP